jgi:two-component system chemotaxis response regulator CheB
MSIASMNTSGINIDRMNAGGMNIGMINSGMMSIRKKIKSLIVDDSIMFQMVLVKALSSDPYIEIVAIANDPFDARDKIIKYEPDVVTCDVEMPKMNGIEFIRRLMPQYPLPVVVVSTVSEAVFSAINAGAVDFVTKPNLNSAKNVEAFIEELVQKVKIASIANISHWKSDRGLSQKETDKDLPQYKSDRSLCQKTGAAKNEYITNNVCEYKKIIAIGASTGGTEAICSILKQLPPYMPGILIVQHIPPVFSKMFADRLNNLTRLKVSEAQTGDYVERGQVLIAPGDAHMRIRKK